MAPALSTAEGPMNTIELNRHAEHWELSLQAPKVNVFNEALLTDLGHALDQVEVDPAPLLILSAHRDFVLGADVTAFPTWFADPADRVIERISETQRLFDRLGSLPIPTLAWVNGFALGGGFELALACDYRMLQSGARVGLPEVTLGLCPGWGGSVRSARLMGTQAATEFVLSGRPVTAERAHQAGLADALGDSKADAIAFLLSGLASDRGQNLPQPALCDVPPIESKPGQRAQSAISGLMNQIQTLSLDSAQAVEVRVFVELAQSSEAAALVQRYLNDQAYKRAAKKQAASQVKTTYVGVLGAGIMGGGIAWQAALCGFDVVVRDLTQEALTLARAEIERLASGALKKGRLNENQVAEIHARLNFATELEALAPCDMIVEAVTERLDIKQAVLQEAQGACRDQAFLTSNTSTISITQLAEGLAQADAFAGLHFFNPVPVMPLVEVIRGQSTSDQTVAELMAFAAALGKRPVLVNDCPGFLVNRVLFPYLNAFDELAAAGHDIANIDRVMQGYGWPMGPGVLSDVIGIDTCVHASDVMAQGFPDRMPVPEPSALRERVNRGHLGQKSGQGFYRFETDARGRLMPAELAPEYRGSSSTLSDSEIIECLMRPMVQELALCVDEGVVSSAAEADTACLLGLGFPTWRCGPLYWGQQMGWVKGYY